MENEQINSKILKSNYIPTAEFYSQIIDSLQDYSIFTIDNEFVINSWSSGATKIFGYEPDEIIGKHFDIIFTAEDIKNGIPKNEIETALKEGRATDNRWHICKDKSEFYAYGLVFPLTGIDGELLGYVKILRDLTERKKSEDAIKNYVKELEDLNTHKESVLAILSHDLRSPLSSIIATAGYLKSNFERMEPNTVKEMLELLYKASIDELNMLDYLVEWARIKYAAEVFSPRKIELVQYVQKVFDTLNDTASLNTINLHHEIDENTKVFADGKMLLSVIQNIVSNAIKHSRPGGEIMVSAKTKDDKIIVQIKDSGVGMSKEIQDKLFTPQMNILSKARIENKGAGIGLLLVKGFLEKNGGEIWVESIEGEGSSFYFTLPMEKPLYKIDSADKIEFDETA
ncbi:MULTISPECIES: PAS domain-containing sensor histidine kinase [Flavobacterium]|uniref:histidine kinase n=1 Tax=Flavobacterium gawalongense TaxID=2594432 RepID=A0A553BCH0_9FLAO|nr:PAS domain-containing sensor histidine kinase [Flavobacterium gawalongense]TRX00283.1 PAS domain S-box protein [Flavobacterium gawalongense]TRX05400.1 PAS domain S-box protein [Flavobacterium gawalongense]TRX05944.1 PAS domain S-box protein [Flavobacterium gawalongense]TRX10270.1 PAS domain S-box protein [Flavobacterium gawalongense]TRX27721.1 PAS domain S-box protein [Flavobacterium gawalongense]